MELRPITNALRDSPPTSLCAAGTDIIYFQMQPCEDTSHSHPSHRSLRPGSLLLSYPTLIDFLIHDPEKASEPRVWISNNPAWFPELTDDLKGLIARTAILKLDPHAPFTQVNQRPRGSGNLDALSSTHPAEFFFLDEGQRPPKVKAKIVYQHDELDCGAACLSMIMQAHGKKMSLRKCRSLVRVTRDGSSMLSIKQGAESLGFATAGFAMEFEHLESTRLPAIAFMRAHFVVIFKADSKHCLIGDPARGLINMPIDEFKEDWSGFLLVFRPEKNLSSEEKSNPRLLLRFLTPFKGTSPALSLAWLTVLALNLIGMLLPVLSQVIFDSLASHGTLDRIVLLCIGLLAGQVLTASLSWALTGLTLSLGRELEFRFFSLFMNHLFKLGLDFFWVRRVGDFMSRLGSLSSIRGTLMSSAMTGGMSLLSGIFYFILLSSYNLTLTFIVLGAGLIMLGTILWLGPILEQLSRRSIVNETRLSSLQIETLQGLDAIKAIGGELGAFWRIRAAYRKCTLQADKVNLMFIGLGLLGGLIMAVSNLGIMAYSFSLFASGQLTIGQVIAVGMIAGGVMGPMMGVLSSYGQWQGLMIATSRVDDVMSVNPESASYVGTSLQRVPNGEIELMDVTYRYGDDWAPSALERISLKIREGEILALVGRSGSGKSTLGLMLNRLVQPTDGRITVGGEYLDEIPLEVARKDVAMVFQDSQLVPGTILENICFGSNNPSLTQAIQAAQMADAHEFIRELPLGYGYLLTEGGKGLSGGQRQKISIARAIYRKPKILVLDEATSALDAFSEQKVIRNIVRLRKENMTVVFITHRLAPVLSADRLIVLERGRVVESGSHTELFERQGAYWELIQSQLA